MIAIAMGLNANLRRVVLGVILAFTLVFIATYIAGVVGLIDRMFIYFPDKTVSTSPESLGLVYEEVFFDTDDGYRLHGWYVPGELDVTFLWFHGNAGNIAGRLANLKLIHDELQVNVFLFDYRGYGRSQGGPSQKGLYQDAEAALTYLRARENGAQAKITYFGRSLGAAVAVELAIHHRPYGLILESAFPSIPYMSEHNYPLVPKWLVKVFVRARYDSLGRISGVDAPMLMLHGDSDDIVPIEAGRTLFDAAEEPKSFYVILGAGHNDIPTAGGPDYFKRLRSFVDGLGL
ncbi:MAG: alpha/beta hydrolase [SAR202 cluster bacterium]|nr:alpha/beta hydrolase [SAR202 cluster bacterium]|tara:strand:- start:448 stop:1317 length:870 start_codon:yes stop_codon:yes gene_type:complete